MPDTLFDGFFWVEALLTSPSPRDRQTRALWHYPQDVSDLTTKFKDIPQFCFPDLYSAKLEKGYNTRSESYAFTLTDSDGGKIYGICFRALFRGVGRRYGVKRRSRHCLCIITRYPLLRLWKVLLQQLHAIALTEQTAGSCRRYLDFLWQEGGKLMQHNRPFDLILSRSVLRDLHVSLRACFPDLHHWSTSTGASSHIVGSGDVSIVPLFEVLGIERFFKLLSALLCERRIVFVSEKVGTLTSTVLAAASMLEPFSWQHIFIPLLPEKLSNYLLAPMPYIIGIKRSMMHELARDMLDGVVLVDVDSGDVKLFGNVHIRDLVGDATSARKQASEAYDQVKAKMGSFLKRSSLIGAGGSGAGDSSSGSNSNSSSSAKSGDVMVVVLMELKAAIAGRPGGNSLQSMLLGKINAVAQTGTRSAEEARLQWVADTDRVLRENLTIFFIYLFVDLEDYIKPSALLGVTSKGWGGGTRASYSNPMAAYGGSSSSSSSSNVGANANEKNYSLDFSDGDSRSLFDWKDYLYRRGKMGDSKLLLEFLNEFLHSQMFEQFCDELLTRVQNKSKVSGARATNTAELGELEAAEGASQGHFSLSRDGFLRKRPNSLTVSTAKQVVVAVRKAGASRKSSLGGDVAGDNGSTSAGNRAVAVGGVCSVTEGFHESTVQFTSGASSLMPWELTVDSDQQRFSFDNIYSLNYSSNSTLNGGTAGAGSAGGGGSSSGSNNYDSKRRMMVGAWLDGILLDTTSSDHFGNIMYTIEFRINSCLEARNRGAAGIAGYRALLLLRILLLEGPLCALTYALDLVPTLRDIAAVNEHNSKGSSFLSLGSYTDAGQVVQLVLNLLMDHKKLTVQRVFHSSWRAGVFPFWPSPSSHTSNSSAFAGPSRATNTFGTLPLTAGTVPAFSDLHASTNSVLQLPSIAKGVVLVSAPELAKGAVEEDDWDEDDDGLLPSSNSAAAVTGESTGSQANSCRSSHRLSGGRYNSFNGSPQPQLSSSASQAAASNDSLPPAIPPNPFDAFDILPAAPATEPAYSSSVIETEMNAGSGADAPPAVVAVQQKTAAPKLKPPPPLPTSLAASRTARAKMTGTSPKRTPAAATTATTTTTASTTNTASATNTASTATAGSSLEAMADIFAANDFSVFDSAPTADTAPAAARPDPSPVVNTGGSDPWSFPASSMTTAFSADPFSTTSFSTTHMPAAAAAENSFDAFAPSQPSISSSLQVPTPPLQPQHYQQQQQQHQQQYYQQHQQYHQQQPFRSSGWSATTLHPSLQAQQASTSQLCTDLNTTNNNNNNTNNTNNRDPFADLSQFASS